MKEIKDLLCINMVRTISYIIAAYFFYVFHTLVGFPPDQDLNSSSITYIVISIFFFLLPLAKKLKLGQLLEYESKISELKTEVKEFKEETRQILSMQNSLINTVSNTINQNINITLPGVKELEDAKKELNKTIKEPTPEDELEEKISKFLYSEGSDLNYALAKLRMDIEKELHRILAKKIDFTSPLSNKNRFMSARALFGEFIKLFPQYSGMYSSFDYIVKVCNAAVHGQNVSQGHSHEALVMGFKMLDELKTINKI